VESSRDQSRGSQDGRSRKLKIEKMIEVKKMAEK